MTLFYYDVILHLEDRSLERNQSCSKTDWLKLEKSCFILSFFLIMHEGGRAVCLSVSLSVSQTFCLSVGWLVGRYVRVHTYVWSFVYICRQTDSRQTDCMHACMYRHKERQKEIVAIFLIHTSFCFTTCLSVRPFVCLLVHVCCLSASLPPYGRVFQPICLFVCR